MKSHERAPTISVCIANFNGVKYIEACIESVLSQDFPLPVEIIVHDDTSTDKSIELIKDRFPEVVLIESDSNVGFCISNNRMAHRAKGEFLLLLNNDAELFPGTLKCLYQEALKGPSILGPSQYNAATQERIDIGNMVDYSLNTVPNLDPSREIVAMVSGGCLWIPKDLWDEIGVSGLVSYLE